MARRLLVSLGGGDAAGLTLKVARALQHVRTPLEATFNALADMVDASLQCDLLDRLAGLT